MGRTRLIGLAVLAVAAVVVFLTAPESGRFSQASCLLLIAVLALLWHLAWSAPSPRAAAPVARDDAVEPPSLLRAAGGTSTAAAPVAGAAPAFVRAATADDDEDLSLLPDPPANWPPPGVEVPLVFRSAVGVDAASPGEVAPPIDAERPTDTEPSTGQAPASEPASDGAPTSDTAAISGGVVIDLTDERIAERSPGTAGDDPWLAFAASMLASKD